MKLSRFILLLLSFCWMNTLQSQLKQALIGPGHCEGTDYEVKEIAGQLGLFDVNQNKFVVDPGPSIWVYDPNTAYAHRMSDDWRFKSYNLIKKDSIGNPTLFYKKTEFPTIIHGSKYDESLYGGHYYFAFKNGGELGDLQNGYHMYPGSENELTNEWSQQKKYQFTFYPTNDSLLIYNNMSESYSRTSSFNSGVFDMNTKTWLIEARYSKVAKYNDLFFALYKDESRKENCDIYKLDKSENKSLKMELIQTIDSEANFDADLLFETFYKSEDGRMIIFEKEEKQGLFQLGFFDAISVVDVGLNKITKAEYDSFFELGEKDHFFIGQRGNEFQVFCNDGILIRSYYNYLFHDSFYIFGDGTKDGWSQVHLDGTAAHLKARDENGNIINHVPINNSFQYSKIKVPEDPSKARIGFKKLSEDLVYILVHEVKENQNVFPIVSWATGEDSLDDNGYTVYYPTDPPVNKSGLYSLKNQKWMIPNQYESVLFSPQAYVCPYTWRDEENNDHFEYHIYDLNFKRRYARKSLKTLDEVEAKGIIINS